MVQAGALAISLLMLRSAAFGKCVAYAGILTHSLDLVHVLTGFFSQSVANIFMAAAGALYLLWFPLVLVSFSKLVTQKRTGIC